MSNDPNKKQPSSTSHSFNCKCESCNSPSSNLHLLANVASTTNSKYPSPWSPTSSSSTSSPASSMTCTYCGKSFAHRGDYNKHVRVHTGEEPYACTICQKRFKHTSNLRRHEVTHLDSKQFRCDQCGGEFSRKDKLASHQQGKSCKRK